MELDGAEHARGPRALCPGRTGRKHAAKWVERVGSQSRLDGKRSVVVAARRLFYNPYCARSTQQASTSRLVEKTRRGAITRLTKRIVPARLTRRQGSRSAHSTRRRLFTSVQPLRYEFAHVQEELPRIRDAKELKRRSRPSMSAVMCLPRQVIGNFPRSSLVNVKRKS